MYGTGRGLWWAFSVRQLYCYVSHGRVDKNVAQKRKCERRKINSINSKCQKVEGLKTNPSIRRLLPSTLSKMIVLLLISMKSIATFSLSSEMLLRVTLLHFLMVFTENTKYKEGTSPEGMFAPYRANL